MASVDGCGNDERMGVSGADPTAVGQVDQAESRERSAAGQVLAGQSEAPDGRCDPAAVIEERKRIAGEIHDVLSQAFMGILLELRVAQRIAGDRPAEAWQLIEQISEHAQRGLAETRRLVWDLQPDAREHRDLVGALSRMLDQMATGRAADMALHVSGTPRAVPPGVGMNILRIAQEVVTNALQHGKARVVRLELAYGNQLVQLRVQDDGRGFDVTHQANGGGFGLIGVGQRVQRLGGQLAIASQPGRGTEVAISVPI